MPINLKIGIIGGSGMENPAFISDFNSKNVSTPYGEPSSELIFGRLEIRIRVCSSSQFLA